MTAADLIARLDAARVTVRLVDGKPRLLFPPGVNGLPLLKELGDDLTTHRAAVLAHYAPRDEEHPGRCCGRCVAILFHESADDQFRYCQSVLCPALRPGLASAPDWLQTGRQIDWARQGAGRAEKARERQDEPVPD